MSNKQKGDMFEIKAKEIMQNFLGCELEEQYKVDIGFSVQKTHKYDFGNEKFVIECKSYSWTEGNDIPSAKLSHLKEVIFYFSLTPNSYKKILVLNKSIRNRDEKSLGTYFVEINRAFILENVEIYEIENSKLEKIYL